MEEKPRVGNIGNRMFKTEEWFGSFRVYSLRELDHLVGKVPYQRQSPLARNKQRPLSMKQRPQARDKQRQLARDKQRPLARAKQRPLIMRVCLRKFFNLQATKEVGGTHPLRLFAYHTCCIWNKMLTF